MQLEGLELGDDAHYPIRLDASGPEFSSLLQKGRIYVQKKARLQPLNGVQESPLRSAAVGGALPVLEAQLLHRAVLFVCRISGCLAVPGPPIGGVCLVLPDRRGSIAKQ